MVPRMNILLICDQILQKEHITNYSNMLSYYIAKEFYNRGYNLFFLPPSKFKADNACLESTISFLEKKDIDLVLAPGVRFFSRFPKEFIATFTQKAKSVIAHIHDGSLLDNVPVDVTYTVKDDRNLYIGNEANRFIRHIKNNYYIGWAADHEIFYPEQGEKELNVFVDHSTFTETAPDYSLNILMHLKKLKQKLESTPIQTFNSLKVITLGNKGLIECDLDNISIEPYTRKAVPLPEFAKALRQAHIFFPTHKESIGLSVLEAAFCGALVVSPVGIINKDRLATIVHEEFSQTIDWGRVLTLLNPEFNSEFASINSWKHVVDNILAGYQVVAKKLIK